MGIDSAVAGKILWSTPKFVQSSFGDRVKHWMTFNEPQQFVSQGYGAGSHAPGRCSDRELSAEGNSVTEPYLSAHHCLLAHAASYELYKRKFKVTMHMLSNNDFFFWETYEVLSNCSGKESWLMCSVI